MTLFPLMSSLLLTLPNPAVPPPRRPSLTPPPPLVDVDGRVVLLRSINVGNKQAPYLPSVTAEDWAQMASWGLNSARLLIFWAAVEPEPGVYDDAWLAEVEALLDDAYTHDVRVVVDLHQDVFGVGFGFDGAPRWACAEALYSRFEPPPGPWWLGYLTPEVATCFSHLWASDDLQAHLLDAWEHVAEALGDHPAVLGFDLFNEPFGGLRFGPHFEREALQPFYEAAIPRIRAHAPDAWIFVEPSVLHNTGAPTFLTPLPFDKVAFAPHFYHLPMEISGTYDGHTRAIEAMLGRFADEARALSMPMWVGELGGNTTSPDFPAFLTDTYDVLDTVQSGGALWEYGADGCGSFTLLGCDGLPKADVVARLARPYPSTTAGALEDLDWDAEARVLVLTWTPDPSVPLPTEVKLPAAAFPDGFEVSVFPPAPTAWDADREVLSIGPITDAELRELRVTGR